MAKYVYVNDYGIVQTTVITGEAGDIVPSDAIPWPDEIDIAQALAYGYDPSTASFVLVPIDKPSDFHVYDVKNKVWVYQQDAATTAGRGERDMRLVQMDGVLCNPLRWASLSDAKKADWAVYRQALLDVPQQAGFPMDITWPVVPT